MIRDIFKNLMIACFACLILSGSAISVDAYKNCLMNIDAYKTADGQLKLKLSTQKKYPDPVIVNKKANNSYVIYLPETSAAAGLVPKLSASGGLVSHVDIKTQPYTQTGASGYTKITLSAIKPIDIAPELVVYGAQTSKPAATAAKPAATAPTTAIKPAATATKPAATATKPAATAAKPAATAAKPAAAPKQVVKPAASTKIAQSKVTKPTTSQKIAQKPTQKPTTVSEPKAPAPTVETPSATPIAQKPAPPKPIPEETPEGMGLFPILLIVLIPLAVIVLLAFGARASIKRVKRQKESFVENLNDQPKEIKDFKEIIENEDMNWHEKYKSYMEKSAEGDKKLAEEDSTVETDSTPLDNLFTETISQDEVSIETLFADSQEPSESAKASEFEVNNEPDVSLSKIFTPSAIETSTKPSEFKPTPTYASPEPVFAPPPPKIDNFAPVSSAIAGLNILSSYQIDAQKALHLVESDGTWALVGCIGDDVFMLKTFSAPKKSLQCRQSELKDDLANFIVRVDNQKWLLELTPISMKLLMEL